MRGSSLGSVTKSLDLSWPWFLHLSNEGGGHKSLGILSLARFYLTVLVYVYVKIEDTFSKARTLTKLPFIYLFIYWLRHIKK